MRGFTNWRGYETRLVFDKDSGEFKAKKVSPTFQDDQKNSTAEVNSIRTTPSGE